MKFYYAKIHFFSSQEDLKICFNSKEEIEFMKKWLTSESRFIQIQWNLYAISSISSVEFGDKEKEILIYDDLSDENKKLIESNPNAFIRFEITK